MSNKSLLGAFLALFGIGGLVVATKKEEGAAALPNETFTTTSPVRDAQDKKRLTASEVMYKAQKLVAAHFPSVDPVMLVAMAKIESSFDPFAYREEKHIGDASHGLMQTLLSTAQWLYDEMGYKAFGRPSEASLYDPDISLYFGGAYVDWLRDYDGVNRSEPWIVESYNGGPNNSNTQTRNHLAKYLRAKAGILK